MECYDETPLNEHRPYDTILFNRTLEHISSMSYRRRPMKIVILGCGRVGSTLATMLDQAGHEVSVIDFSSEAFQRLSPDFRGETIPGNGVDEEVLIRAGIREAGAFAAVTNGDNRNIM